MKTKLLYILLSLSLVLGISLNFICKEGNFISIKHRIKKYLVSHSLLYLKGRVCIFIAFQFCNMTDKVRMASKKIVKNLWVIPNMSHTKYNKNLSYYIYSTVLPWVYPNTSYENK